MVGVNGSGITGGCMNIRNTFGVCIAVLLLPQGGCSENRQSRNFRRTLEDANTGNAIASYRLARMYDHGEGAPEDDVEAVKWYRVAAQQGHPSAQYYLGVMHDKGHGVPEDATEAIKWYRLAAQQGDWEAIVTVAGMYANGKGVPEDDVEAYAWYLVLHESRQLSWHRDIIAKQKERLTAEQLTEAQKRATELLENYGRRN